MTTVFLDVLPPEPVAVSAFPMWVIPAALCLCAVAAVLIIRAVRKK